jgi:hypothetical protein
MLLLAFSSTEDGMKSEEQVMRGERERERERKTERRIRRGRFPLENREQMLRLRAHRQAAGRIGDGKGAAPNSVGNEGIGRGGECERGRRRYREESKTSHYRDASRRRGERAIADTKGGFVRIGIEGIARRALGQAAKGVLGRRAAERPGRGKEKQERVEEEPKKKKRTES